MGLSLAGGDKLVQAGQVMVPAFGAVAETFYTGYQALVGEAELGKAFFGAADVEMDLGAGPFTFVA